MIHWDPIFFKGQAPAWFISLFLSDTTEWINWIENHCSNCCMGTHSSLRPNFRHISFSGWPFPVSFSFFPLVYSSIMVANYNYPIQVTCFFPLWILKSFYCYLFFCLFVSTGILITLPVFSYIWEYGPRDMFHSENPTNPRNHFNYYQIQSFLKCHVLFRHAWWSSSPYGKEWKESIHPTFYWRFI